MDFLNPEENSLLELLQSGKRVLIITGEINSGKTSAVEKLIFLLQSAGKKTCGVYSRGILKDNKKIGFEIVDIKSGRAKQIASVHAESNFNVSQGRYFFNVDIFDEYNKIIMNSFDEDVIIIDEIGPLELKDGGFFPLIQNCLANFKGKLVFVIRDHLIENVLAKFNLGLDDAVIFKTS